MLERQFIMDGASLNESRISTPIPLLNGPKFREGLGDYIASPLLISIFWSESTAQVQGYGD